MQSFQKSIALQQLDPGNYFKKRYNPMVPTIPKVLLNLFSQVGALLHDSRFLHAESYIPHPEAGLP